MPLLLDRRALVEDRETLALIVPILREVNYRRTHPFYAYRPDDAPDRNQLEFHKCQAPNRLVFGGKQSGKSRSVAQEIAWILTGTHPYQATRPAARVYVVSANYRTVQEGIWKHLRYMLPRWEIEKTGPNVPSWDIPQWIKMRSGAQVDFITAKGREEARRVLQAAEIDVLVVDEEIDGEVQQEGQYRLLARNGIFIVSATLDRSEQWCLDFEDRAEAGDPNVRVFRLSTYAAARAGHLSQEKLDEIEAQLSEEERKVKLLGRSRRHEGLVYSTFDIHRHVIPERDFVMPKDVTRYVGVDDGQNTAAMLWFAVLPNGKIILYRELYTHNKQVLDFLKIAIAMEGYERVEGTELWRETPKSELVEQRWIDPHSFAKTITGDFGWGELLAQYSMELGLGTRFAVGPARNDVIVGIEACRLSLAPETDGIPRLRILSTCKEFLREIRSYRWKRNDTNQHQDDRADRPTKKNDHAMDAWRYATNMGLKFIPEPFRRVRRVADALPPVDMSSFTVDMQERLKDHWARTLARLEERELVSEYE